MDLANSLSPWSGIPLKSRVVLLLAVLCVFAGIGFANDIAQLGRQPAPLLVGTVLIIGTFAVCYTASSIILRQKFWKAFLPLFVLQALCFAFLAMKFPGAVQSLQWNTGQLQNRLAFDACAVMPLIER